MKRIIFLTSFDPRIPTVRSGTPYFMLQALKRQGYKIEIIGPIKLPFERVFQGINRILDKILKKRFDYKHSSLTSRYYSKKFSERLRKIDIYDGDSVIFAPLSSVEISDLKSNIPIIYTSDTSFEQLANYNSDYNNYFGFSYADSCKVEDRAISKSRIVTYPSEWAAAYARNKYQTPEKLFKVINWGANFIEEPDSNHIENVSSTANSGPINCLFVGVNWDRKGGEIALKAIEYARSLGCDISLTVCGCSPSLEQHSWIRVNGFLDKDIESDRHLLAASYYEADLFILPTKAESYGHVFCEAAAYGLPVIAHNTGGISSIVKDSHTGFLFDDGNDYISMGESIVELYNDRDKLRAMAHNAMRRYQEELSWDSWGGHMRGLIEDI